MMLKEGEYTERFCLWRFPGLFRELKEKDFHEAMVRRSPPYGDLPVHFGTGEYFLQESEARPSDSQGRPGHAQPHLGWFRRGIPENEVGWEAVDVSSEPVDVAWEPVDAPREEVEMMWEAVETDDEPGRQGPTAKCDVFQVMTTSPARDVGPTRCRP